MTDSDDQIIEIKARLERLIAGYGSAVIGFSAGVDSSVVAAAALAALGDRALAVTAVTETITEEDLALAEEISSTLGLRHEWIRYNELEIPGYAANPANRCYYCKDALYTRLAELARVRGIAVLLDGTNADDAGDYRPGRLAAAEQNVRSPLLELGIDKATVRRLAQLYSLPNDEKPSAPCLSSRVPYGTEITIDVLTRIGRAERALRRLGFSEMRVRHHGEVARIELPKADLPRAIDLSEQIVEAITGAGYRYVSLDLMGLRSGSLNEVLTQIQLPTA